MENLTINEWLYDGIWNEYPFLRLLELKRKYQGLHCLLKTIPAEQLAELEAHLLMNCNGDVIPFAQCFNDLKQEIADIDKYIGGN